MPEHAHAQVAEEGLADARGQDDRATARGSAPRPRRPRTAPPRGSSAPTSPARDPGVDPVLAPAPGRQGGTPPARPRSRVASAMRPQNGRSICQTRRATLLPLALLELLLVGDGAVRPPHQARRHCRSTTCRGRHRGLPPPPPLPRPRRRRGSTARARCGRAPSARAAPRGCPPPPRARGRAARHGRRARSSPDGGR